MAAQDRALIKALVENLAHPYWGVSRAAQGTLTAFAGQELLRKRMEEAGLTPVQLGLPAGVGWIGVARMEEAQKGLSSLPGYGELSLGGRAVLRRKLMLAADSVSEGVLRAQGERWLTHLVRLEGLDRAAGLASAGAEGHLPVEDGSGALECLVTQLAAGVGMHSMVPWILEAGGRQIDIRLLPAYPSVFRRLLAELLRDEALEGQRVVGAHYSVGLDLGKELVPVALALYYGDENYLEAPVAGSAEGGVGFPGVWTYRGQSLDLRTGGVTGQNQSNFHLRPLRTFVGLIQVDLFQGDVDRLGWLVSAAAAGEEDPRRQVYEEFLEEWERWVHAQGGKDLLGTIRAAEEEIRSKTGQGVSPALDRASAGLLAAMYETPEKGAAARKELSALLRETLLKLESGSWGGAVAAGAIRAYRESEGLADLDRTHANAVRVVTKQIFSAERGSQQEGRLLRTLEALDPERAQQVRTSLEPGKPPTTGLEELGTELATLDGFFQALGRSAPGGLTPVLVGAGLEERYPQMGLLAAAPGSPILLSSGDLTLDVVRLVSRDAREVIFVGSEEEASALRTQAALAGIEVTRVISPGQPVEFQAFILAVLAEAAGTEEAALAARREFGDMLDTAVSLAGQL